jgi:hypothetical protein
MSTSNGYKVAVLTPLAETRWTLPAGCHLEGDVPTGTTLSRTEGPADAVYDLALSTPS